MNCAKCREEYDSETYPCSCPKCYPKVTDVTKSTLPKNKDWGEMAEDLLARFPCVDRAELLKKMVAGCFFDMRFGNKREERAACDLLNLIQAEAVKQLKAYAEPANVSNSATGDRGASPAKADGKA